MIDNPLLQPRGIQATTLAAAGVGLIGGTACRAFAPHHVDGVDALVIAQEVGANVAVGAAHVDGVLLHSRGQEGAEQQEGEDGGGGVAGFAHHRVRVSCRAPVICVLWKGD